MRLNRQHVLLAGAALCLVIAILFFSIAPPPANHPAAAPGPGAPPLSLGSGTAGNGDFPSADSTTAAKTTPAASSTANSSQPSLDDLRGRAEVNGQKARTLRRRYLINDPDPESFDSKPTIDTTARVAADLEYQQRKASMLVRERLAAADQALAADLQTEIQKLPSASMNAVQTPSETAQQKQRARETELLRQATAEARLKAEAAQLREASLAVDALAHPNDALKEYLTAKEDYLLAKARYQAARLIPLPPQQTKDWRRPFSNSK